MKSMDMAIRFQKILITTALFISVFYSLSCERPTILEDEDLINSLYERANDTLAFKSSEYILETVLYRNFMPGGPIPKNRPLITLLYLTNIDSLDISEDLKLDKVYVINGNLIFKSTPEYLDDISLPNYKQIYISRDGPEWETEIMVDVIVKITNQTTNEISYLIARDQKIEKVW